MGSDSFTTPGSYTWNRPSDLQFVRFRVAGAPASDATTGGSSASTGAAGAGQLIVFTVSDPTSLPADIPLNVGGEGGGATSPQDSSGFDESAQGGFGGESSDVRTSTALSDRFGVGGGGGGGGAADSDDGSEAIAGDGGDAGLPSGQNGGTAANSAAGGDGGTQSDGFSQPDGESGASESGTNEAASSGAGGDGYWGGFAGEPRVDTDDADAYAGGGGGGSSYYNESLASLDSTSAHTSGDGFVEILYIGTPTNLTVTAFDADSISLDWDAATGADQYAIYRATSSGSTTADYTEVATTSTVGYTDSNLLNGERYYYRVTAEDTSEGLESSVSNEVNQLTDLPAPTNLTHPSVGASTSDYDWTANHNNGETRVEYREAGASAWQTFATVANDVEAETVTGLLNGTDYESRVVAETEHTETEDQ